MAGAWAQKFQDLTKTPLEEQTAFFQHRFVFALGDRYEEVKDVESKFKEALKHDDGKETLSAAGAADFLQKLGKTRTAKQRKEELQDVDVNGDGRTSFIEYLLLHFKILILEEHFKRLDKPPTVDMGNDGLGLIGVGSMLIEEMFAPPAGLDPELDAMMKAFSLDHARKQKEIADLQAIVDEGGVKGMAAKTRLEKLKNEDQSGIHAVEAKIAAAIKRANKKSAEEVKRREDYIKEREKGKADETKAKAADRIAKFSS